MDLYLFNLINQFALRWFWLDILAIFLAEYFGYVLILSLLIPALYRACSGSGFLALGFRKYFRMIIEIIISALLARFVIVELIRWFWQRPRPFPNGIPAFPSGHAAFFFALSTVVFLYNKKIGILFYLASFLICLARIFTGLHWPTDILVGAVVGIFSAWLIHKISKKL